MVTAAAADGAGAHTLAFYALLLAVPALAAAVLAELGELLDGAHAHLHASLWAAVLALTVTGAASRAPDVSRDLVPGLARSTLLACLGIFCVQAVVAVATELRR